MRVSPVNVERLYLTKMAAVNTVNNIKSSANPAPSRKKSSDSTFSAFTHVQLLVGIKSLRKRSRARKLDQVLLFSKSLCSQDSRKWP